MGGLSDDLQKSLRDLEPLLQKLAERKTTVRTDAEQMDQLQVMVELRQSLDSLNANLDRLQPRARAGWFWRQRGRV